MRPPPAFCAWYANVSVNVAPQTSQVAPFDVDEPALQGSEQ